MAIPQYAGGIPAYNAQPSDLVDPAAVDASLNAPAEAPGAPPAPTGKRVDVIDKDGKAISIDEAELPKALRLGYQPETPEQKAVRLYLDKNKGTGAALEVGLRKFADEATFGAAEPLFRSIEEDSTDPLFRAKQEALMKQHKIAGYVGGGLGFATSLLYGGPLFDAASGAGKATKAAILGTEALEKAGGEAIGEGLAALAPEGAAAVARKAGPGFARKLIASGAGGAVEGAVFSAPKALTEASLGDPDQAAETLLYGAGIGSLIGLVGPAAKQIKKGFTTAAEGVAASEGKSSGIAKFLTEQADNQTWRSLGGKLKASKAAARIEGGEAGIGKMIAENGLDKKPFESMADWGKRLGEARAETSEGGIGKAISTLDATGSPNVTAGDIAKRLKEDVAAPLRKKFAGTEAASRIDSALAEMTDHFGEDRSLTFSDLHDIGQKFGADAKYEASARTKTASALRQLDGKFRKLMYESAESVNPEAAALWKEANLKIRQLSVAEKAVQEAGSAQSSNRAFGLSSHLVGLGAAAAGLATGHPVGAALGLAGAFANKLLLEEGNAVAGKTLRGLAEIFGNASARNPLDVGGLLGIEQAQKLAAEELDAIPGVLSGTMRKSALETLPEHAAIDFVNAFRGAAGGASKMESFKTLADEITSLTADPTKMRTRLEEVLAPYSKDAPTIAGMYGAKAADALMYLQQTMPKDKHPPNPFAPRDWKPTETDLSQWARRWEVAMDPFSAVARVADGSLTKADVETVQRLYPKMYDRMRQAVIEYGMSPDVKTMPYAQRIKLSMLMQAPIDPSLRNVGALQSIFTQHPESEEQGKPGGPGPGPGGGKHPAKTPGPHAKVDAGAFGAESDVQRIAAK